MNWAGPLRLEILLGRPEDLQPCEGSKTLKTKDPAKAKADYYYFEGKVKGPPLKAPVHLQMQLDDKEKTRIKSGSSQLKAFSIRQTCWQSL